MNSEYILNGLVNDLKGVGVKMGTVLEASAKNGAIINNLLSKKDEMPPEIFEQLDSSLKMAGENKGAIIEQFAKLDEILKTHKDGNNSSR